jgi:hypothetical protein
VNTWIVPARNAIFDSHGKALGVHTTSAGSALPTKYSISAAW